MGKQLLDRGHAAFAKVAFDLIAVGKGSREPGGDFRHRRRRCEPVPGSARGSAVLTGPRSRVRPSIALQGHLGRLRDILVASLSVLGTAHYGAARFRARPPGGGSLMVRVTVSLNFFF